MSQKSFKNSLEVSIFPFSPPDPFIDIGVPKIIWRGMEASDTITVTECLGPNLKKLFLLMNKEFSLPTIANIAIQVVRNFIIVPTLVC